VMVEPGGARADAVGFLTRSRQGHEHHVFEALQPSHPPGHVVAVQLGEADVEEDHFRGGGPGDLQRPEAVVDHLDPMSARLQQSGQDLGPIHVVIHDEDFPGRGVDRWSMARKMGIGRATTAGTGCLLDVPVRLTSNVFFENDRRNGTGGGRGPDRPGFVPATRLADPPGGFGQVLWSDAGVQWDDQGLLGAKESGQSLDRAADDADEIVCSLNIS